MPNSVVSPSWCLVLALMATVLSGCKSTEEAPKLAALGTVIDQTSVSGISSGAYMAGQFQVAYSKIVVGAGIVAGGPYGCAESVFSPYSDGPAAVMLNANKAISGCMLNLMAFWGVPSASGLADKTKSLAASGRIDPVASLVTDRVYLFSGKNDHTVVPAIVNSAAEYYADLGIPEANITFVNSYPAGHAFVTEAEGQACEVSGSPYVVDCDYDQAGALLRAIYGELKPRADAPQGKLTPFDQSEFVRDLAVHGMADRGYVYTPDACQTGTACRVHVAFHGCAQNEAMVGDAFIRSTGLGRWADTNGLIVLLPQIASGVSGNPQACWDWWGYTGRGFLTRDAPQMVAVHRMLERLAAARPTP